MLMLIKGGRVVDPGHMDGIADILIEDGRICKIIPMELENNSDQPSKLQHAVTQIIDASGKIVTPGLIDMHVHLREPGQEHKETIATGCRAAVAGGFTGICCMPNSNPVNDSRQVTKFIMEKASQANFARVYPVAAISKGLAGKTLCEYGELKAAGAIAVSDDGNPVMDSRLMRKALESVRDLGLLSISHCEDLDLAADGVMNAGPVADRLGLPGISNASESIMVQRDIALSQITGAPVHIAHVSAAESVQAVREAKASGIAVTAETAPHYFTLTDAAVQEYSTNAKMNPPLRSGQDREAIRRGLADGTIDAIATDHAPHASSEKKVAFEKAPNGIIGLETALPLGLQLARDGVISIQTLIEKMSTNPARLLKLEHGLTAGRPADISIIDPDLAFTVEADKLHSLSRNMPYDGWQMIGKAVLTMVEGRIVFDEMQSEKNRT